MASGSLLVLVPYFAYVFDFLDPEKVIARIGAETLERATSRKQTRVGRRPTPPIAPGAGARRPRAPGRHRGERARAEGQGDRDRRVGGAAPAAGRVPAAQGRRSTPTGSRSARRCAPIPTSSRWPPIRSTIWRSRRTWLEWKGLRQIREVFGAALTTMPEMAHVVAIDTRYVGEAALAASRPRGAGADREVHEHLPARGAERARRAHRVQRAQPVPPARRVAAGDAATPGRRRCWSTSPATSSTTRGSRTASASASSPRRPPTTCARCARWRATSTPPATIACWRVFLEIDKEPETQAEETRAARRAQGAGEAGVLLPAARPAGARAPHLRRHGQRVARAAALDPRRDAGDHLQGLLGGRRPRHQLRLPVRRAQREAARVLRELRLARRSAPAAE